MENHMEGMAAQERQERQESPADAFISKRSVEITEVQSKVEENFTTRDKVVSNAAEVLRMSPEQLQEKLQLTNGWLYENKTAAWYAKDNLEQINNDEFFALVCESNILAKENNKLKQSIEKNQRTISLIENCKSEEGKKEILKNISTPRDVATLREADNLLEAELVTESELIDCLNVRITKIFSAYENGEEAKWLGPHGDTPEYESRLELAYAPESIQQMIKNSPLASPQLVGALS